MSPSAISAEPSAWRAMPVSIAIGRSSSGARPSGRGVELMASWLRRRRRDGIRRTGSPRRRAGGVISGSTSGVATMSFRKMSGRVRSTWPPSVSAGSPLTRILTRDVSATLCSVVSTSGADDGELLVGPERQARIQRQIEHGLALGHQKRVAELHLRRNDGDQAFPGRPPLELREERLQVGGAAGRLRNVALLGCRSMPFWSGKNSVTRTVSEPAPAWRPAAP